MLVGLPLVANNAPDLAATAQRSGAYGPLPPAPRRRDAKRNRQARIPASLFFKMEMAFEGNTPSHPRKSILRELT